LAFPWVLKAVNRHIPWDERKKISCPVSQQAVKVRKVVQGFLERHFVEAWRKRQ
jgi:hypothetical protein